MASTATAETTVATWKGMTAEQYREMARDARRRSYESFERCDTDGFLSQAASDATAREYDLQAEILDNGGKSTFLALFDLEGNQVPAKYIETRYGWSWALLDPAKPEGRFLGFFNESNARKEETRLANNAKKGYYVGRVRVPAFAKIGGGWSWTAYAERLDGGYSADAEIVDNGR